MSWYQFFASTLIPQGQKFHYILKPGGNVRELAGIMHDRGYLSHPYYLILYTRLSGTSKQLQAGEYEFSAGTTAKMLLSKMLKGETVIHKITLVEGWDFAEIKSALAKAPMLTNNIHNESNPKLLLQLGVKQKNPEGLFFPDTYRYKMGNTDLEILHTAYKKMQSVLNNAWQTRAKNLPFKTPYQALIVASMIEKETGDNAEKPIIAGVIINRLHKHMYLQIDPTVIYGVRHTYDGTITRQDLRSDSPYNTYRHKGLPPTPIAMPGLASINAALHPDKTEYLYFVAKGDGSHVFSKTLKEHDVAIRRYLLRS